MPDHVMLFRLTFNGHALGFESSTDAFELLGRILQPSSTMASPARIRRGPTFLTAALDMEAARSWQAPKHLRPFLDSLRENERLVLGALATCAGELTLDQLREAADLSSTGEASVMIGRLKRLALDYDLDWSKLLTFRIVGTRKERTSIYRAGPLLTNRLPSSE